MGIVSWILGKGWNPQRVEQDVEPREAVEGLSELPLAESAARDMERVEQASEIRRRRLTLQEAADRMGVCSYSHLAALASKGSIPYSWGTSASGQQARKVSAPELRQWFSERPELLRKAGYSKPALRGTSVPARDLDEEAVLQNGAPFTNPHSGEGLEYPERGSIGLPLVEVEAATGYAIEELSRMCRHNEIAAGKTRSATDYTPYRWEIPAAEVEQMMERTKRMEEVHHG